MLVSFKLRRSGPGGLIKNNIKILLRIGAGCSILYLLAKLADKIGMHQTFYIDIDEEITSIVERLRKARANEVIIVVPKRALLIQSIVNLRLLKKEAQDLGIQLMVVTQDKLGKLMVEKAGILVQQKLDEGMEEEEIISADKNVIGNSKTLDYVSEEAKGRGEQKSRLDNLGSENYFDDAPQKIEVNRQTPKPVEKEEKTENILNKELVSRGGMDIVRKTRPETLPETEMNKPEEYPKSSPAYGSSQAAFGKSSFGGYAPASSEEQKDGKIEKFFYNDSYSKSTENQRAKYQEPKNPINWGKFVLRFVLVAVIAGIIIGAYLFIPKATISIAVSEKTKSQEASIKGDASASAINYDSAVIPAKLISVSENITKKFSSTGSKSSSNQKAKGTITIYNEFSSSPQPLVATTRFLSESGKLFRLVSGVTVPGTSKVGEETKPGAVEAEVIADESGTSFNIDPTKFTIPGFQGNSGKYSKFYAKSSKAMAGGGSGNDQIKAISENDINSAKSSIQSGINEAMLAKAKESAGDEYIILSEAVNIDETSYQFSNSVGEVTENFQVTAQVKASALAFREDDLKNVVNALVAKSSGDKVNIDSSSLDVQYGKADPDFKAGTMNIKVQGTNSLGLGFDINGFKKNILGKSNLEVEEILNNYPDIEKAEVTYWPPFISGKIPRFESRVEVILDK